MNLKKNISIAICLAGLSNTLQSQQKPNIIYILADDMGYADLGCYGSKHIKTPNIDQLASEGIRFTNHYAGTSVSAPSRCSLMTGLNTGHCQIRGNLQAKPYGQIQLQENTQTIAGYLKKAGYTTAMIGKWGMGVEGTTGEPTKQGFDYYCGYLCQVLAHNHYPEYLIENGIKFYLGNKVQYCDSSHWTKGLGSYATEKVKSSQEVFTEKAVSFINSNKSNPFFLYYSVIIPHDNSEAPEGKQFSSTPALSPYEKENWTDNEKGYAAMITFLDAEIGKLIKTLKKNGLYKNTLIIFTSDNGGNSPGFFEHESNFPFSGGKRDLYEGGIRIPFIAHWPEKIIPGRVSSHQSAFWDFMPTACEIAGIKLTEPTDGISYLPELLNKKQIKHESLYFEFHELGGKQALIKDNWKCIRLNVDNANKTSVELYNLKTDSLELHNLATQNPEKVKELMESMNNNRTRNENFLFGFEK